MKRMVDDKEIRNFDDRITALEQGGGVVVDAYTKAQSDAKFLAKANLTDYSINDIIVADSEIQSGEVELRAVSAQDVKSEISLDPTSAIIKTTSGTNNSTIGVSGTEIDISTGTLKYNGKEVVKVGSSPTFENVSISNDSYSSNNFQGIVIDYMESGDNDSGWIKMYGNCPELYSYNDHLHGEYGNSSSLRMVEDIIINKTGYSNYPDGFYDISYNLIDTLGSYGTRITALEQSYASPVSTYTLALGANGYNFWYATITAEAGLENTYTGANALQFIEKYARYVSWYYENSNDTSGDNHKICTFATPGQQLNWYLADGSIKITSIPPTAAVLTVTKSN